MLVYGMVDQLPATSDAQFSILSKQLQVLHESPQVAQSMDVPASRIEGTDTEHTVVKLRGWSKLLSRNPMRSWASGIWLSILVSALIHL